MSDNELFETDDSAPAPTPKVKKEKKPRKPMTEERKQALREQLAKAREKSAESRKKKKLLKDLEKEEQKKSDNAKIAKSLLNKDPLEDQIQLLKEEIKSLKESGSSNNSSEVKELREELNLFKKGLAEQIAKAKHEKLEKVSELKSKDNNIDKDVEANKEQPKPPQQPDLPVVSNGIDAKPPPKKHIVLTSRYRGGYKN